MSMPYVFDCICLYKYKEIEEECEDYKPCDAKSDKDCIHYYENDDETWCCDLEKNIHHAIAELYLKVASNKDFQKVLMKML